MVVFLWGFGGLGRGKGSGSGDGDGWGWGWGGGFGYLYHHYTSKAFFSLQSHSFIGLCQKSGQDWCWYSRFWGKVEVRRMADDGSDDVYVVRFVCGVYIFLVGYSASLPAWSGSSGSVEASSA